MFQRIRAMFGRPASGPGDGVNMTTADLLDAYRAIEARYDAAEPSDDLWHLAEMNDADAAMRADVRRKINTRAQHEHDNNPVVRRVVDTYVDDLVGETGPLLQSSTGAADIDLVIETEWAKWWAAIRGGAKLATAVRTQNVRGEVVALRRHDEQLLAHGVVTLDPYLVEPERLATPSIGMEYLSNYIDGVHLDPVTKNPIRYDILKAHPGSGAFDVQGLQFIADTFDADQVYHAFRAERPEQHRGLTTFAPALPTAGDHRKLLVATRKAAQMAAYFSLIGTTDLPPDVDIPSGVNDRAWQTLTLPNSGGGLMMLPFGRGVHQLKAEHPNNTLEAFHKVLVSQMAGCFTMPLSRALGWHVTSGYAPIRGEIIPYFKRITSDRTNVWEPLFLDLLFGQFLDELLLAHPAFDGVDGADLDLRSHAWDWPENDLVVDPARDENARQKKLAMGTTSRGRETRVSDLDREDQRAAAEFGMTLPEYRRAIARATFNLAKEELPLSPVSVDDGGGDGETDDNPGEGQDQPDETEDATTAVS
jgi:hypothetical protein